MYCEYLKRIDSKNLEKNLNDSIKIHSEIQYIQTLKIKNLNIPTFPNYYNSGTSGINELQEGKSPYSIIYSNLTSIKHLIQKKNIQKANALKKQILDDIEFNRIKVPRDLVVEVKIQLIKLNLLEERFADNTSLFDEIESFGKIPEDLKNEVHQLKFINYFRNGDFDECKSLILRFFFEINTSVSENDVCLINTWKYFDICIYFAGGSHRRALNLIAQFPARPAVPVGIQINLKILEIYIYFLLGKNELIDLKIPSFKSLINKTGVNHDRYNHLLKQFERAQKEEYQNIKFLPEHSTPGDMGNILNYPADVLDYELIPLSYFEQKFQRESTTVNIEQL